MIQPITDTLKHIGGGYLLDEAAEKLAKLVSSVGETGRPGKMTIELTLKKATRGGAMLITGKTKLSAPAEEPMEAMLFATPEGNLVADDPNQKSLDLKIIGPSGGAATPAALKVASA